MPGSRAVERLVLKMGYDIRLACVMVKGLLPSDQSAGGPFIHSGVIGCFGGSFSSFVNIAAETSHAQRIDSSRNTHVAPRKSSSTTRPKEAACNER